MFFLQVRDIIDEYEKLEMHAAEVSDWYEQQLKDVKSQEAESFVQAYKIVCMYEDELSENALIAATEEELQTQLETLQVAICSII